MIKNIDDIARLTHQRNKIYCETIGDPASPDWDDAPAWMRESAINGVKHTLKHYPNVSPRKSHENWLEHKALSGWVYGPVKDGEKKTHPCMVPYDNLPARQRVKDDIFMNTVLGEMGLTMKNI